METNVRHTSITLIFDSIREILDGFCDTALEEEDNGFIRLIQSY